MLAVEKFTSFFEYRYNNCNGNVMATKIATESPLDYLKYCQLYAPDFYTDKQRKITDADCRRIRTFKSYYKLSFEDHIYVKCYQIDFRSLGRRFLEKFNVNSKKNVNAKSSL
jgi:hypothetical protein